MAIADKPQISFDDKVIDDNELLRDLDRWSAAKEALDEAREDFSPLDKKIKGKVADMDLEEGDYRCGRFVIGVHRGEPRHVEFDRKETTSIRIKQPKDD